MSRPIPLLRVESVTKRYGTVTVLDNVQLEVRAGEVHALLGANGAGKSTLCKIIAGLLCPDNANMQIEGQPFSPANKRTAESYGIQIVQQELNLIETLTVAENILLERLPTSFGIISRKELERKAAAALNRLGLSSINLQSTVSNLGVGSQQMVEIAKALDRDCKILILDEPTAALSGGEADRLFEQISKLQSVGVGIIYISHRLDDVARISDRFTVLRDGKYVDTFETSSVSTDRMVELMSGPQATNQETFTSEMTASRAMVVRGISGGIVDDVSFSVNHGERVGVTGLVGSGRTELLRLIFGADSPSDGEVQICGAAGPNEPNETKGICFAHPGHAVKAGLAMVTEDRKRNGLLLSQSVCHNMTLAGLSKRFSLGGLIRQKDENRVTRKMVGSMEIRCNSGQQLARTLSGGNQQKVAVSKWLVRDANIFLFDEPTRGIDVPARRSIYRLFKSLAQSGKAMVIVSSDLEELFEVCDRILVMSAGKLVAEFNRDNWSTEAIMKASFSGYKEQETE